MNPWLIVSIVCFVIIGSDLIVQFLVVPAIVGKKLYFHFLCRKGGNNWERVCSDPTNYEQRIMWDRGLAWAKENAACKTDVEQVSDGFHLYGEYYDFGSKNAVIIVPGRAESLCYSYFYAPSYQRAGYNVLVIDKRSHGKSDGMYEDCGKHSSIDIVRWAQMLHDRFGVEHITLHGICVGSAICLYAYNRPECPAYVDHLITDGMFTTFYVSFRRHIQELHRQAFPTTDFTVIHAHHYTHTDLKHDGPIYQIAKTKKPTMLMFTKLDHYTLPKDAEELYRRCGAEKKKLVWFDKGLHSHVRINNEEKYDTEIAAFLKE